MMLLNKILVILSGLYILACQTGGGYKYESYKIDGIDLQVIQAFSNRIQQKCVFLDAEGEGSWRHQYLIFVLNSTNEVLEIADPLNMDKESCQEQIVKIEKILKAEPSVKLCGRDGLRKRVSNLVAGKIQPILVLSVFIK